MPSSNEVIQDLTNELSARAHTVRATTRGTTAFQIAVDRLFASLLNGYMYTTCPVGAENVWSAFVPTREAANHTYEVHTGKTLGAGTVEEERSAFIARFSSQIIEMRERPSSTAAYALTLSIENSANYRSTPELQRMIVEAEALLAGNTNVQMPTGERTQPKKDYTKEYVFFAGMGIAFALAWDLYQKRDKR